MKKYDVAIIGGGLTGLIAAIDLAKAGRSVVLLERSNRIGGRARTSVKNGAFFNMGSHALYLGGAAESIYKEFNVELKSRKPPTSGYLGIWQGKLRGLPTDPMKMLTSNLLSWSGKIELARFLMRLMKKDANTIPAVSVREWIERELHNPMTRHIAYALIRVSTYTQDPDNQMAGPVIRLLQQGLKQGVLYLDGGWQTIVNQLGYKAISAGATILDGKSVSKIEYGNHVQRIVCANGDIFNASYVLSTLSPSETFKLVENAEHTALRMWKDQARPSVAASLILCLRRLPVPKRNVVFGLDIPVFFSNHSAAAKLTSDDSVVVHLTKYNGHGGSDAKADEQTFEQVLDLIHPGWKKEVITKQYLPSMVVVHDYMHIGRTDAFPGPSVPEIEGLYVAGDWASHGEGLSDAAAASARRASKAILTALERDNIQVPIRIASM
jgi:phytoene dehydrogenase-like protein